MPRSLSALEDALEGIGLEEDWILGDEDKIDWSGLDVFDDEEDLTFSCAVCRTSIVLKDGPAQDGDWIGKCEVCVGEKMRSLRSEICGDEDEVEKRFLKAQAKDKHYFGRRFCATCKGWYRFSPRSRKCKCDKDKPFLESRERAVDRHLGAPKFRGRRSASSGGGAKKLAISDVTPPQILWTNTDAICELAIAGGPPKKDPAFARISLRLSSTTFPVASDYLLADDNKRYRIRFNARALLFPDGIPVSDHEGGKTADIVLQFPDGTTIEKNNAIAFHEEATTKDSEKETSRIVPANKNSEE